MTKKYTYKLFFVEKLIFLISHQLY